MQTEFNEPGINSDNIIAFIRLAGLGLVNNYSLEEDLHDVPTEFTDFFAIMEISRQRQVIMTFSTMEQPMSRYDLAHTIVAAGIPNRVRAMGIPDEPAAQYTNMDSVLLLGLPYAVFAVGHIQGQEKQVNSLFAVRGFSPQTLLTIFQEKARKALRNLQ